MMSEIRHKDLSDDDDDIFIIKQFKPINKLTLQQALIIKHTVLKSLSSRENKKKKKKKKEKKLNSEQKHKTEEQHSIEKFFKACQAKENSSSFSSSPEIAVLEEITTQGDGKNKGRGKKNKKDRSTKKAECEPERQESGELAELISIESPVSGTAVEASVGLFNDEGNTRANGKRVKLSPEDSPVSKKFKDCTSAPESVEENEFKDVKPLMEELVKSLENESTVKEIIKNEISDTSKLFINVPDDIKIEVNYEDFLSPIEDNIPQSLNSAFEGIGDIINWSGSELLCFSLKKIICNEIKKQAELEQNSAKNGRTVQKLFTGKECEVFKKFFHLEDQTCKLFVRMLLRKRSWRKVSDIKYEDIDDDLEKHFNILKNINFVDTNVEDEDFPTQLDLLKKSEIVTLCRAFNIALKSQKKNASCKKNELILSLLENCRTQKSVYDSFKKGMLTHREILLKSELKKMLGMCMKINDETFKVFQKILILFSFPYYYDEEEKRLRSAIQKYVDVHKYMVKYPEYELSPSVVFESRDDFDEYQTALNLLNDFEKAVANKNYDEFREIATEVKKRFQNILTNYEYHDRFSTLPSFLKKFSAGTVYARILTNYCYSFKKKTEASVIVETVKLLLDQKLFLQRKRGKWYETLLKALDTKSGISKVAEIIVTSLKDPLVDEVQKLSLQLRGQGILRKKNHTMIEAGLRKDLEVLCTVTVEEPASIEIKGKALESNNLGMKCVYVQNTSSGKAYVSVEERAITYYKSHGYTKGYHVEGYIIHSIYYVLFFDIMYKLSPEGVFQNRYQEFPLDFNSTLFYLNRRDEIDKLLAAMPSWNDKKVEDTIKDVFSKHYNTVCAIAWSEEFTPQLFCEVIKCITMPTLVLILQRLTQNFGVYKSGFPDLTLWNPETNKIKFVEVKSPNDRLSPNQRVWLNFLRNIGLSTEVCNVKNLSGKNFE